MFSRSSRERPEKGLETFRVILPGTSLGRHIRTSPARHFETSQGRQIGTSPGCQFATSPGWSNRIFRGRPGDVLGTSWRPIFASWDKDIGEIEKVLNENFENICDRFVDNILSIHFGDYKTKSILFASQ